MIELLAAGLGRVLSMSWPTKLLIAIAVAGAVAAGASAIYGMWHHEVFKSGYDRAMLDIAQADAKAIERASSLRNAWRACRDESGSWDQTTGTCR